MSRIHYLDIYKRYYPYKDIDTKNTSGKYFISKSIIKPNHPYSVTFTEYKRILDKYMELAKDRLEKGKTLDLPYNMGSIYIFT